MLSAQDQHRVVQLLQTVKAPRGGAGKVIVTFTLNFAPGGTLHRMQYGIGEEGDVPPLAKSPTVR